MSATPTPTESPVHVQPLHNPSQAAHVVVPQAPLGNATNGTASQAPGLGAKALLAKKMAKNINPKFVSPTDNMMTPCTKKISAAKQKHFTARSKPAQPLFAQKEVRESDKSDDSADESSSAAKMDVDDENPF